MKPKRIILIRHGQSEGNLDPDIYAQKPDYALLLTVLGHRQAQDAGSRLRGLVGEGNIRFYVSPLFRTRQTFREIARAFPESQFRHGEEPRLREQEWGHLRDRKACDSVDTARDAYGTFYYRIPDGESAADVYDRVSDFFGTLFRDFEKDSFPENAVMVTHGMTIRLFLMRWCHWTVEEFEQLANPGNCGIFILEQRVDGRYDLVTVPERRPAKHAWRLQN